MVSTTASSVQQCQEHIVTITRAFTASFPQRFAIVTIALPYLTWVSTGVNDCGVLADSETGEMMKNDKFSIPSTCKLRPCSFDPLPHFCWGRDFPFENLGNDASTRKLDDNQQIFKYRLSRAHLTIENTFG